ncbi:hypothetical protein MCAV_01230 [[Mycoplasma] cavipharyngis]|uniref:hypothetical protein n=1 Tax=[Mycoplasma] cavipharyngis TaxID=92757 RepID=UPI00370373DF
MINDATLNSEQVKLKKYLEILLTSQLIVNDLKNSELKQTLLKALNIFYYLSEKIGRLSEARKIIEQYNSFSEEKFVLSKNISYQEDYQLIDDVNYLNVFIKNVYGEEITSLKKIEPNKDLDANSLDNNSFVKSNQFDQNNINNKTKSEQIQESYSAFNGFGFGTNKNLRQVFDETSKSLFLQQQIQKEISNGSLYIYKTKPREIIFLKYLLLVFFSFVTILCIIFSIAIFLNTKTLLSIQQLENILDKNIVDSLRTRNQTDIPLFPINTISVTLLFLIFSVYMQIRIYRELWNNDNDNTKYFLSTKILVLIIFLIIISLVLDRTGVFINSIFRFANNAINYFSNTEPNSANVALYSTIYYSFMLIIIFSLICILLLVAAFFFNPKFDRQKIDQRINEINLELSR